jgi:hypothetical protein
VSEDYARELTTDRAQAVEVEKIGDDPPVRIGHGSRQSATAVERSINS